MNSQLPPLSDFKTIPTNYDIAMIMNNYKKRLDDVKKRRTKNSKDELILYNDLHYQNPKKNYMLETKYTQIERENRLLFQKIEGINRKKHHSKHKSFSQNHISSLNSIIRKQQVEEIQKQNVKMLSRIKNQKASISFRQTQRQYLKNKQISHRLSNLNKNRLQDWFI